MSMVAQRVRMKMKNQAIMTKMKKMKRTRFSYVMFSLTIPMRPIQLK